MSRNPANPALRKAVIVLEELAGSPEPLRYSELMERTGLPKASLHRTLCGLRQEGLVRVDECTRGYELGNRLLSLVCERDGHAIHRFAEPELRQLNDETGETVHLTVLDGTEVVYVSRVECRHRVRPVGDGRRRAPVHCTGVGKALLALRPLEEQARIVARIDFRRYTDRTIVCAEDLRRQLEIIATRGYALDEGELDPDITCVAAPIIGRRGYSVASLSVSAPSYRAERSQTEWIRLVTRAAGKVSERVVTGGRG